MAHIELIGSADFYIEKIIVKKPLQAMHHHRSFELYYLAKGEREYFIEDRFFKVAAEDLVCIPRKVLHRTAGEGGLRYLLHFSEDFLLKYFTPAMLKPLLEGLPLVFRAEESERDRVSTILRILLEEYSKAEREQIAQNEALLSGYLYQLLFLMTYGNNTYVPYDYADERITQIIQYINENYNCISDIEQIADHFFVSKYYLCRFFRKNLGVSLISYLNTIKIQEACRIIKSSNMSLTTVAMQCGFNSSSYFCKVFKNQKGTSPTEYKKRHRQ